jgi:hypothetical protein
MQALSFIRPEARRSAEAFALKADPPQKKRYYRFFSDGPEGGSRGSEPGGLASAVKHTALEEAEKELELKNWKTMYTSVNNQLGDTLRQVQMRAQGDKLGVLQVHAILIKLGDFNSLNLNIASVEGNFHAKRSGTISFHLLENVRAH